MLQTQTVGHIMEIFTGIQGEGPWIGIQQIFFRLFRCNLRCSWCDTPESFHLTGKGRVESPPFSRQFKEFKNPLSVESSLQILKPFLENPHHSLSFTGGEPLLQANFLLELFYQLHQKGEKIFLETSGSLPDLVEPLLQYIEYVSMDIKLPSSAKERGLWNKHEKFLQLISNKKAYVKIILTLDSLEEEILQALALIKDIAIQFPVILQPVSPINGILPPNEQQLLRWQKIASEQIPDVRVIPQVHKLMGHI